MTKGIRFLLFTMMLLASCFAGGRAEANPQFIEHDGQQRDYYVFQPPRLALPARTMVILHGGQGTAEGLFNTPELRELANEYKWLLIMPQGVERTWNSSYLPLEAKGAVSTADDVGFLQALINKHVQDGFTKSNSVVMTGASRGGLMTSRFACDHGTFLAGFGLGIGNHHLENPCNPPKPLQAFFMHGSEDKIMDFNGRVDAARRDKSKTVGILSVNEVVNIWTTANRCQGEPRVGFVDNVPEDQTSLEYRDFQSCLQPTRQIVGVGMGHTWPNGKPVPPPSKWGERIFGKTFARSAETSINREIFQFFDNIPR